MVYNEDNIILYNTPVYRFRARHVPQQIILFRRNDEIISCISSFYFISFFLFYFVLRKGGTLRLTKVAHAWKQFLRQQQTNLQIQRRTCIKANQFFILTSENPNLVFANVLRHLQLGVFQLVLLSVGVFSKDLLVVIVIATINCAVCLKFCSWSFGNPDAYTVTNYYRPESNTTPEEL